MTRRLISSLTIIATLALAACGSGGGGSATSPHVNGFLATPKATVAFSVRVPQSTTASAAARQAKYISSATQSVTFSLTSYNSQPVSVAPVVVSLTGANCTGSGLGKVCTVTSTAPVGTDIYTIQTYSTTDGTGTPLSFGFDTVTVTQAGPNNLATTLYGVISSLVFVPASAACLDGTACTGSVNLVVRDAANATIIGPGNGFFSTGGSFDAIHVNCQPHLAPQNSSGTAITQPYANPSIIDLAKIAYDGTSLGAGGGTLTCTATDNASATATFTLTTSATASATWTLN